MVSDEPVLALTLLPRTECTLGNGGGGGAAASEPPGEPPGEPPVPMAVSAGAGGSLMLHRLDAFVELMHLPSLQVLRVRAGEMLFMPKGTVHMVITTEQKLQVSWHLY